MKLILSVICCILFLFSELYSQNFNDALRLSEPGIGSSAKALGMGNAYSASGSDFSAVLLNPAGIALNSKMEFAGALNYNSYDNDASFFNSSTAASESSTKFSQFGLILPFPTYRGSFVVAFGYNQSKDFTQSLKYEGFNSGNNSFIQYLTSLNDDVSYLLGTSYPLFDNNDEYIKDTTLINGNLTQSGNILEEGDLNKWSFAVGTEVAENLFVGGTFNIISGNYKRTRDYYEDDYDDIYGSNLWLDPSDEDTRDFLTFAISDIIDWEIDGWDAKLGIIYAADKNIKLGATVKFPSKIRIEETYFLDGYSEFGSGVRFELEDSEDKIEYDIKTPLEFTTAASVSFEPVTINGDITFIDYSEMEFTDGLDADSRNENNKEIDLLFRNTINYNFGAQVDLPDNRIKLRCGFIFKQSPFEDDPSGFDKKYLTAGVGFTADKNLELDAAFAHGWWDNYIDNYDTEISRVDQELTHNNFVLTLRYKF
ncbi:MAG: outer membrane protein transport protein [Ignavibacteria bacterium]